MYSHVKGTRKTNDYRERQREREHIREETGERERRGEWDLEKKGHQH
jgi:hypothetical protein